MVLSNLFIFLFYRLYKQNLVRAELSKSFTDSQAKTLAERKKRVRWGIKDISQGLILRTLSKKAYQYIRSNQIFPLPAISTLRKWIRNFKCQPGIQLPILRIIKEKILAENSASYRAASLSFDEMDMSRQHQYDHRNDQVLGPNKKLQVAVARGIVGGWKQQIFFDFDAPMSKELLFKIIIQCEEHQIEIWDIVCDLGNRGLLKDLGVTPEKPYFINPACPARKEYVFPDAPHLLKLLRNHLLDEGYQLQDGTKISGRDIEKILDHDINEYKIHHKLQPIHFNCTGSTRQRVRLAAQLISHTTATAIRCLFPLKSKLADWLELFDTWFDIFNSAFPISKKKLGCAFGKHFSEQSAILDQVSTCVETMHAIGKKSLLPFQKGMLISINALKGLYQDLKSFHHIEYLLTARLNQDPAENTFTQVRGIGHSHTHPGPVDCANRLRLIMLGKNCNVIVENPSVAMEKEPKSEDSAKVLDVVLMQELLNPITIPED